MAQRWLVVWSQASFERAEASVNKASQREAEAINKQLFHLQAKRFETPGQAHQALSGLANTWRYHHIESHALIDHTRYATKDRPTADTPIKVTQWQMQAQVRPDAERIGDAKQCQACFVLGSNIAREQLNDAEVMAGYKGQAQAEGGFRFLKDPLFFVSSLFVKKPCRIQGLLMVTASSSSHEERHNGKYPEQHRVDHSRYRVSACQIFPDGEPLQPEHERQFCNEQEGQCHDTHTKPVKRCGRHRQTPHGPPRRKHDNDEHDGHLQQLGDSRVETRDDPEDAYGSKDEACPEDEGEIEEASF